MLQRQRRDLLDQRLAGEQPLRGVLLDGACDRDDAVLDEARPDNVGQLPQCRLVLLQRGKERCQYEQQDRQREHKPEQQHEQHQE